VFIAIHLDLGEAEFWQQYESANECVIATALCCLVTPRCDRPAARRLLPTLPAPAALVGAMCAYDPPCSRRRAGRARREMGLAARPISDHDIIMKRRRP